MQYVKLKRCNRVRRSRVPSQAGHTEISLYGFSSSHLVKCLIGSQKTAKPQTKRKIGLQSTLPGLKICPKIIFFCKFHCVIHCHGINIITLKGPLYLGRERLVRVDG